MSEYYDENMHFLEHVQDQVAVLSGIFFHVVGNHYFSSYLWIKDIKLVKNRII